MDKRPRPTRPKTAQQDQSQTPLQTIYSTTRDVSQTMENGPQTMENGSQRSDQRRQMNAKDDGSKTVHRRINPKTHSTENFDKALGILVLQPD